MNYMNWFKIWLGYSTILFFWCVNVIRQDVIWFGFAVLIYISISHMTIMAVNRSKNELEEQQRELKRKLARLNGKNFS